MDPKTEAPATDLYALGWRQGSILPRALAQQLVALAPRQTPLGPTDLVITVSHDCDLCQPDDAKEPWAELLLVRTDLRRLDGRCTNLKSPRDLHFRCRVEGRDASCAVSAADRWSVPRGRLSEATPHGKLQTEPADLIPSWLSRRYIRVALPTTFNERAKGAVREAMSVIDEHGEDLDAIYLILDDDEKPADEPYLVVMRGTVFEAVWADGTRRAVAQRALNAVETTLAQANGIEVVDSRLVSEADLSLHDIRAMKRWDLFDTMSIRGDTPAAQFGRRPGR